MFRCGIIGCGFIGCQAPDNHMKAYGDCKDTELFACCDVDMDKARLTQYGLYKPYLNYKEMVQRETLDIISICTPPETHREITCYTASFVRAIYCEKPIALTLEDADKMIEVCHKNNVVLQINHQRRFLRPKVRFSRGVLNTGSHMFDLLRHLFGEIEIRDRKTVVFQNKLFCDIEEVDTEEPVFEFDFTHNKEPMILAGVTHLVECLENGRQSISNGEEAREALRLALLYKELNE